MADIAQWAARCLFFKPFWDRRHRRVILDVVLQQELLQADAESQRPLAKTILHQLFATNHEDEKTWVFTAQNQRPQTLGKQRWPGVEWVDAGNLIEVLQTTDWQLAVLDLSYVAEAVRESVLQVLQPMIQSGERQVILTLSTQAWTQGLAAFGQWVSPWFPRARIYAMAPLAIMAVVDCGDVRLDEEEEQEEVSVAFDNSLGGDLSGELEYLALLGFWRGLPEGMSLIELPPSMLGQVDALGRRETLYAQIQSLRWQLEQAQEQVRRLTQQPIHTLEAELASLRARLARFESLD